jgi:hypothetical protein
MKLINQTQAEININGTYTAEQIETLIVKLGTLREQMTPAVTPLLPDFNNAADTTSISVQNDFTYVCRELKNGDIRLWLRHTGFGWFAFNLLRIKAIALRDHLAVTTNNDAGTVNLITQDLTSRH